MATRRDSRRRLESLANDLDAVEQIRQRKPDLDWDDDDNVLVHSISNMLRNEIYFLESKKTTTGPRMLVAAVRSKVKAALRSAGYRASRTFTTFTLVSSRDEREALPEENYEDGSREVRGSSSSPSLGSTGSHSLARRVRFSYSHSDAATDSYDQPNQALVVIAGKQVLPLSGTF